VDVSGLKGMKMISIDLLADIAEMKRIYAAIDRVVSDRNPAAIIVSSAAPQEGKTLVTAGLAALAARQSGQKTLAVDLNWFAPTLHLYFSIEQRFGLDALRLGDNILDLIEPSGFKQLDILAAPSMKAHQGEEDRYGFFLGSDIIRKVRTEYDCIFIDTSSVFPTNRQMMDPVALSTVTDGVILVVRADATSRQKVKHAKIVLETSGASVLGAVVNYRKSSQSGD
jgi:Mrp family chromosome partitioning ATPase